MTSREWAVPNPRETLKKLHKENVGYDTSDGLLFNHGIWGRDRIITAMDELDYNPEIARETILTLAKIQGTAFNATSEEEPGKIHNEYRDITNWEAPSNLKFGARILSRFLGGNHEQYLTYFAADSTPLFISLVSKYAREINPGILDETLEDKDGKQISVRQSFRHAIRWVETHIQKNGLVSAQKTNPFFFHQTWRDGHQSNPRPDGSIPNFADPIEYLDIQALSANALDDAALVFETQKPETARTLRTEAVEIRRKTIETMWMEDKQFFAVGREKDSSGNYRLIETIQSNPGWLLNSNFFDDLPHDQRQKYLTGVIKRLFSNEFLNDCGIRTRSVRHAWDQDIADYHGSFVSWPVDTFMFAKGLRRQGFSKLAEQLENRILNYVNFVGEHSELFIVDEYGKVVVDINSATQRENGARELPVQMLPEKDIAWTTTAVAKILREREGNLAVLEQRPECQMDLEEEILERIKDVQVFETEREVRENMPQNPAIYLNHALGLSKSVTAGLPQAVKHLTSKTTRTFSENIFNKIGSEEFRRKYAENWVPIISKCGPAGKHWLKWHPENEPCPVCVVRKNGSDCLSKKRPSTAKTIPGQKIERGVDYLIEQGLKRYERRVSRKL